MFKCTDCEKLYNVKPEYCDCGNDTFEFIEETEKVAASSVTKKTKSFDFASSKINEYLASFDIFSVLIFILCLILSVLALIFIKPFPSASQESQTKPKMLVSDVPNIEDLWQNPLPVLPKESIENKVEKPKTIVKPVFKSPKVVQQTPVVKNQVKQNVEKSKQVHKEKKELISKEKGENSETVQPKQEKVVAVKSESVKQEPKKVFDVELDNYKIALRQALFNNLAVTSVVGSGQCTIEFSIDKSGKLVERNFIQQSPNETVNQAVYNMMMRLPHYYPPPESYNGQKLRLNFLFDNGSYAIKYLN